MERIRKSALVTGASSGIGKEISKVLCDMGVEVYGTGRDFGTAGPELEQNPLFHGITCDMTDDKALNVMLEFIRTRADISILVNNAGCAYYGLHEELNSRKIREMVRLDLEVPMVVTQALLRHLKSKQGYIINISSVTGRSYANPHGAVYGACKAGLLSFGNSIFEEARKYGIKVTTIMPDITDTALYRNADFEADTEDGASLSAEDVAEAVRFVLERPEGVTVPELMIRPQRHRIKRKKKK
jgi:short-subunit dehydrogenase